MRTVRTGRSGSDESEYSVEIRDQKCAVVCGAPSFRSWTTHQNHGRNAADLARSHMNTRVVDNQSRLLREIAKRSGRPSRAAVLSALTDFTLIDCHNNDEFRWYIESLITQSLLFRTPGNATTINLTLTVEGWKYVQPLLQPGGIPGQCFVAMWFSDETRAAYDEGIKPAIVKAGCIPVRIDQKEHNNEIPDEIIAEIRNSQSWLPTSQDNALAFTTKLDLRWDSVGKSFGVAARTKSESFISTRITKTTLIGRLPKICTQDCTHASGRRFWMRRGKRDL